MKPQSRSRLTRALFLVAVLLLVSAPLTSSRTLETVFSSKKTSAKLDFSSVKGELLVKPFSKSVFSQCVKVEKSGNILYLNYDVLCKTCGEDSFEVASTANLEDETTVKVKIRCEADVLLVTNEEKFTSIDGFYKKKLREYVGVLAKEGFAARYADLPTTLENRLLANLELEWKVDFDDYVRVKLLLDAAIEEAKLGEKNTGYVVILGGPKIVPMPFSYHKIIEGTEIVKEKVFSDRFYLHSPKIVAELDFEKMVEEKRRKIVVARMPTPEKGALSKSTYLVSIALDNALKTRKKTQKKPLVITLNPVPPDTEMMPVLDLDWNEKETNQFYGGASEASKLLFKKDYCEEFLEGRDEDKCVLAPPYCETAFLINAEEIVGKTVEKKEKCDKQKWYDKLALTDFLVVYSHCSGEKYSVNIDFWNYVILNSNSKLPLLKNKPVIVSSACLGASLKPEKPIATAFIARGASAQIQSANPIGWALMLMDFQKSCAEWDMLLVPTEYDFVYALLKEMKKNDAARNKLALGEVFLKTQDYLLLTGKRLQGKGVAAFFSPLNAVSYQFYGDPTLKISLAS